MGHNLGSLVTSCWESRRIIPRSWWSFGSGHCLSSLSSSDGPLGEKTVGSKTVTVQINTIPNEER